MVHKIETMGKTTKEKVEELTGKLVDETNRYGVEEDFIEGMTKGIKDRHRTLQQTFFRCLKGVIKEYSKTSGDLRNEDSIEWAKKVSKIESDMRVI